MKNYLDACCQAARAGGQQLEAFRNSFTIRSKGKNDLVTDADFAAQRAIHDYLFEQFPEHRFAGEEDIDLPMSRNTESEFSWIVDPLDGTLNYVHQLPSWSVSVALMHGKQVIAGAVFDPWLNELYSASIDSDAKLNGNPVQTSACEKIEEALLIVSLPTNVQRGSPEIADVVSLFCNARSVRRLGSAALNLCYVASGRSDGYWATSLSLWDMAAGWLILERAGGTVTNLSGGPIDIGRPMLVAAANARLGKQILAAISQ